MLSQVLKNERLEHRYDLQMQGYDIEKVAERVAALFSRVKARSALCYWVVKELEMSGADVARRLKISKSAVSLSVVRGEKIATDMELKLIKDYKRNKSTPSL